VASSGAEAGVAAASFRPSSQDYGRTVGSVIRCALCGHGSLALEVSAETVDEAYADAIDEVSLREEAGQVATAARDVALIERFVAPAALLDVGCWTGSLLEAARARGWDVAGVEPSAWAAARARDRGFNVQQATLDDASLAPRSYRAVTACDVLEHLLDPGDALDRIAGLLEPNGVLFATVPDAGSRLAKVLGKRWWSVLPMHVQYYTAGSLSALLLRHGFQVEYTGTHAKIFSTRYYAERVASFVPFLGWLPSTLDRVRVGARPVAPNFGDRLAVVARLAPKGDGPAAEA
jgi:2-polyprenyl-3-methyl-5-hydroxy-6-metoxy-1,4-benzoquinol methylase